MSDPVECDRVQGIILHLLDRLECLETSRTYRASHRQRLSVEVSKLNSEADALSAALDHLVPLHLALNDETESEKEDAALLIPEISDIMRFDDNPELHELLCRYARFSMQIAPVDRPEQDPIADLLPDDEPSTRPPADTQQSLSADLIAAKSALMAETQRLEEAARAIRDAARLPPLAETTATGLAELREDLVRRRY